MVRVVAVGSGGIESCSAASLATLRQTDPEQRFHASPGHPSFSWLAECGVPCRPLPRQGIQAGVIAVPLDLDDAASAAEREDRRESLEALVQVVDRLLGPGGCPWDQEQTHETLKRHLLEEAYEVLDAIDSGNPDTLAEELGDLLLQPIMHAQMERLAGNFDIADVARRIRRKLVHRHPHVFGQVEVSGPDEVLRNWDRIKQLEKGDGARSILAGVPRGMASLLRAYEISKRAARCGFEWPNFEAVFEKMREEEAELREALGQGDPARIESEIGDLLFTVVNVARWAGIEPEEALRKMLNRFTDRFMRMEVLADRPLKELSPDAWDALWEQAKRELG
ncbi:MAG: nucleoside triphosphate pyrophosphohydrolase [Fimbriimonadaceae bacterium]